MRCHSRKRSASGISLKRKKDSGQAGMTNILILMNSLVNQIRTTIYDDALSTSLHHLPGGDNAEELLRLEVVTK